MIHMINGGGKSKLTATADTVIVTACGGDVGYTNILNISYTAAGTAHVGTLMRAATYAKVTAEVAAAGASVVVDKILYDGAGNSIAASDYVAVRLDNGDWHLSLVTSWTVGTLTIVLTTAVPANRKILKGAEIFCYGVPGDAMHAANQLTLTASATTNFPALAGQEIVICKNRFPKCPIIFHSTNATAAGTLNMINWGNTK